MSLITCEEYDRIFKDNIVYDDLGGDMENFYEYNNNPYSGVGFGDSEVSGRLNKLYIYNEGLKSGICRKWHHNGFIEEETLEYIYQDGYKKKWDEKGEIIYESIILRGFLIYKKIVTENNKIEENIYKDNIRLFKDVIKYREIEKKQYLNTIAEKRFVDTRYYNKILDIFEELDDNCSEDSLNEAVEKIKALSVYENKHRYSVYDRTANIEELEIKDGIILNNGELYTGLITKFIDDESLNCNMLYSLTECKDGKKDGIEIIWDFEGRLNPAGIQKYGVHYEEYWWWSKEIIKEIRYFQHGKLLEKQEWDNSSLKG